MGTRGKIADGMAHLCNANRPRKAMHHRCGDARIPDRGSDFVCHDSSGLPEAGPCLASGCLTPSPSGIARGPPQSSSSSINIR